MVRREVLASIPKAVNLYVINSNFTRLPYVYCDDESFDDVAFFFDIKENAEKKSKELLKIRQNNTVEELNQEGMLKTLARLVIAGVNAIKYNYQGEDFIIQLDELIKISDFSNLPPEKRPIENRALQLTMLYFGQEIRSNPESPNIPVIKDLEEEMLVNILKARFIVPAMEAKVDGETRMQMLMIKMENGSGNVIPLFTDNIEFDKMMSDKDKNIKKTAIDAKNLINIPLSSECDGFLINPMGVSIPLNSAILDNLRNMEIVTEDKKEN